MTLKDLQMKLYESLKPSGWADKLKMFLLSDEFYSIIKTLNLNVQAGERFTPPIKDIFSFLKECPYDSLKVVVINNKPFYDANRSDGLALSTKDDYVNIGLKSFYADLEKEMYPEGIFWNPSLKYLSNQGVLLMNIALTTQVEKSDPHYELWKPLIEYILEILNTYNTGIPYVYLGSEAKKWSSKTNNSNYKFFLTHPIEDLDIKREYEWTSNGAFKAINKICFDQYGEEIQWAITKKND